jgi:hypothetical protein
MSSVDICHFKVNCAVRQNLPFILLEWLQGGLKLQAWTLAVLPHSLVGHSMTYGVTKILKPIDI